ncbi:replication protein [Escherichia coli]|uniref:replication protein n=2 Tax=Escherichia coli TaxID=562 RepID=UPI0010A9C8BF|nr:replication protein [Escherichia coli]EMB0570961.1 replication protein [Escherichia coli]MBY8780387.1 replication protein [Escherichia coli]MBZ2263893.1 replication protein [Escherichia coli]MBZ2309827.1 replication protein [Escherichia coli]MBZ2355529.1 replication protein [Escherichia coli]
MSNLATVTPIRPSLAVVERQVADLDDGFTRLANMLLEEYAGADLTKRQFKVLLAVLRLTYGWNKPMDRIANSQIAQIAKLPEKRVSEARVQLVEMNLLVQAGRRIGPNKNTSEWSIPQNKGESLNIGDKQSLKLGDSNPSNQGDTKDIIPKKEIQIPPTPQGEGAGQEIKPAKKKSPTLDYQAVMSAYNSTLGDRLPQAEALSDKRRKAIKRLLTELKEPTIEAVENYFSAFAKNAKPFYFGENDTGWRASFDYLLRSETLIKTREGSL